MGQVALGLQLGAQFRDLGAGRGQPPGRVPKLAAGLVERLLRQALLLAQRRILGSLIEKALPRPDSGYAETGRGKPRDCLLYTSRCV